MLTASTLPKIELHLHLDCSLSYNVVRALRPAVTEDIYWDDYVASPKCAGLPDYLARTRASVALLQSARALELAVEDLFQRLAEDGVIYAEIRFAPLLHLEDGLAPAQVVEVVEAAANRASAATGVEGGLILCTLRHFSAGQSLQTAHLAEQFKGSRVVALDIAGDEAGFGLDAHVPAFEHAAAHGIHRTAHAGEGAGPGSVWETLERLAPTRIGHGVRSSEDPALVEHLRQTGVHLEVCPYCNVQIDLYPTLSAHPIDHLYRAGVSLNVNTDARGVTPTTLSADYERLAETFGWGPADLLQTNLHAAAAAFAPPELKAALAQRLQAEYKIES